MPKIQVNERDLSWYYRQRDPGQLTVLMPGVSTFGPHEPTLVDESNFLRTFGGKAISPYDTSYQMAYSFVKTGISVLFWRQELEGEKTASCTIGTDTVTYTRGTSAYSDGDIIDTDDDPIVGSQGQGNSITFRAKYPGSFGNSLSVLFDNAGSLKRLIVFLNGVVAETLFLSFDPDSSYYYKFALENSSYIAVPTDEDIIGDATKVVSKNEDGKIVALPLGGGKNGVDFTDKTSLVSTVVAALTREVNRVPSHEDPRENVFSQLNDPYLYDFNIAISAGFSGASKNEKISVIDGAFTDLCMKKGTAVYFVDGSEDMSAEEFYTYTGLPATAEDVPEPDLSTVGFNTSYAAATGPWMNSVLVSNGATASLPGSYAQLISWGQSISRGTPLWMAPAGVKRASLGGIVKSASRYEVGSAILDLWQNHDNAVDVLTEHNVNPIMRLKQYGYVIYGNSTLLQTRYDSVGGKTTSMLQSLSVRILSNMIKTQAFNISLQLQFDQIDDDLFAEFKTLMTVYMDQLKYGRALYDYEIIADRSAMTLDDLNSRTVPVTIRISPNPAAENFIINLEISQAGVTFGGDSVEDNGSVTE